VEGFLPGGKWGALGHASAEVIWTPMELEQAFTEVADNNLISPRVSRSLLWQLTVSSRNAL